MLRDAGLANEGVTSLLQGRELQIYGHASSEVHEKRPLTKTPKKVLGVSNHSSFRYDIELFSIPFGNISVFIGAAASACRACPKRFPPACDGTPREAPPEVG